MKIQLCQTHIIWENKKENLNNAKKLISESKCDILFFPEMSFTGFSMNTDATGENNNFTLDYMQNAALMSDKAIAFGWVCKNNEKAENHYTFIDNKGNILSDYIKIHPFSYSNEDKYFNKGSKINIFEYKGFKFSTFICYDLRFPEIFQKASLQADIITVAACWPQARREHWLTLLKARAIENVCYIAAVNCAGNIDNTQYSGDSCIISPDGKIIDILSYKEGNIICNIENDVDKYRSSFPVKNDRREDLYKIL